MGLKNGLQRSLSACRLYPNKCTRSRIIAALFLLKANNQIFASPKQGDVDAAQNYMTKFINMSELIKYYHNKLTEQEHDKYSLNDKPVRIRNAFAHGRLVAPTKDLPWTLWKFGRTQKSGRVLIEFNEVLTTEWLENTWKMIGEQKERVDACSAGRGYLPVQG
jgi:hypothetical protein